MLSVDFSRRILAAMLLPCFLFPFRTAEAFDDDDQIPICTSVKCSCDHDSRTVTCRSLVFEYVPDFPDWTETLILNGNHLPLLKDGSFEGLINLKRFYMSGSGLEYIESGAFKGLTELTVLELSHNRLYYWPAETLQPLSALKVLNLSANAFDDITVFTKLLPFDQIQLNELILGQNRFVRQSADFVRLPPMRRLDLSGSAFSSITGRIVTLLPDENKRNLTVRIDALAQADELNLYACHALLDPSFFDAVRNVIDLNIGANRIDQSASILPKLAAFPRLQALNVSRLDVNGSVATWNTFPIMIRSIDLSHLNIQQISFSNLHSNNQLHTFTASKNQIQTFFLPSVLSNLQHLRLDGNRLIAFPTFQTGAKFESLVYLDLADNLITKIDPSSLHAFPNLAHLSLAHNRIVHVHQLAFSKCCLRTLQTLDLSHNSIEKLPTFIFWSLKELNLESNRLTELSNGTLSWSTNLEKLDVSYNTQLMSERNLFKCSPEIGSTTVPYRDPNRFCALSGPWIDELASLEKLKQFSARGVNLAAIPSIPFSKLLSRLEYLDLSENLITTEQWEPIASSVSAKQCIRTLKLRRNRLTTLKNLTIFRGDCLETLDLKENPFDCDCQMEPIYSILKSLPGSEREIYNESLYYCFSPSNYYRYPLCEFASNLQPCSFYDSNQSAASTGGLRAILATFLGLVALVLMAVFCRACLGSAIRYGFHLRQRMYKPLRVIISRSGSEPSSPTML